MHCFDNIRKIKIFKGGKSMWFDKDEVCCDLGNVLFRYQLYDTQVGVIVLKYCIRESVYSKMGNGAVRGTYSPYLNKCWQN